MTRVGKEGATDACEEGVVFELGRDSWEGATQLGGWVAVSRFLKFPILGNFAGLEKSRLRPPARTFARLAVGGYTRRSEGENRKGRAVERLLGRSCLLLLPAVTCKGNPVPVHGVLLSRGSLRSAGESTSTARATSAPFQQRLLPLPGGI